MDSFLHNHQSALDSQREDDAIHDLENAGIYPDPENDAVLENLYEEAYVELCQKYITLTEDEENALIQLATDLAKKRFEELPDPDYKHYPMENEELQND